MIRKEAGLFCGSFLRKGEVLAYVGSIQNLKELKGTPSQIKVRYGQFIVPFFAPPAWPSQKPRSVNHPPPRVLDGSAESFYGTALCDPLLRSERKQGFSADPFDGRARCSPMLGEIET